MDALGVVTRGWGERNSRCWLQVAEEQDEEQILWAAKSTGMGVVMEMGIAAMAKGWNFHETYNRKDRQQLLKLAGREHLRTHLEG